MGCTSSAPSVASPDANATKEHSVKFVQCLDEKDRKGQDKTGMEDRNETKELINVLPKCDTITEPIQVVISNNKSLTDLRSLDNVKVTQETENVSESNGNNPLLESYDNKIPILEKIVERVIQTKMDNNCDYKNQDEDQENHNIEEQNVTLELNYAPLNANEEDMQKDEHCEEPASPDQSLSSRVTRWEALADIAAELPPSLAVDPVTGQIYALSK